MVRKKVNPARNASAPSAEQSTEPKEAGKLNVLFVAAHDSLGGAARAAYRVFDAIRRYQAERIDITFRVIHKTRDDSAIIGGKPTRNRLEYLEYFLRTRLRKKFPRRPFVSDNTLLHSQALYPSGLGREINATNPDVVMLGWLGNATLSIEEIGKIKPPIVFRLSDMWVFSGSEHYTATKRYAVGYSRRSRPVSEFGPDIDRETFRRKVKKWKKPAFLVALSSWLAQEAKSSTLTREWPIEVIPVPIDVDYWKPVQSAAARKALDLPEENEIILFGAGSGTAQFHKGSDLIFSSLPLLRARIEASGIQKNPIIAIFGEERPDELVSGFRITFLGRLDDKGLRNAYSAASLMVVPSRLEAFGQVAAEAQSCGTPVVAFNNSGLTDVVIDQKTGRLVEAFDLNDLADSIYWCLEDESRLMSLSKEARTQAVNSWNPQTISAMYARVFELAAEKTSRSNRLKGRTK